MEFAVRRLLGICLVVSMLHHVALAYNKCALQTLTCLGVNFTSVRCSWNQPSLTSQYTVQWIMDTSTSICEGSTLINGSYICDIHNLSPGKNRFIELRVRSHADNQTQVFRNSYSSLECAIPNPPNEVEVNPLTSNSFQVIWTVPKDWPMKNENLLAYQIKYRSQFDEDGAWRMAPGSHVQTPPYSQAVTNLPYHCSGYQVKIICRTAGVTGKQSAWSNIVSVRTTQLAPIGEMHDIDFQHLHDKTQSRSILLMWKPIPLTKTCSPLLGYRIMVCTLPKECSTINIPANVTRYHIKDLLKESAYNFYLSAYNVVGQSKTVNISIPALPVTPEAKSNKSRERYILYISLIVPLVILTVILTRLAYYKLKSLFQPVPEPNIPSFPEYKLNPNPYKPSCEDKEFYSLLNESSGEQSIPLNVEVEKEPMYQYRSVSISDSGELEVVQYQLLRCEDYVKPAPEKELLKPPSEKDTSQGSSCSSIASISPYAQLADGKLVDMSSNGSKHTVVDTFDNVKIPASSNGLRTDSSMIAKKGQILEKMLQQRKCKFIVCRDDGYAVIVEDVRHQKTEEAV